MDAGANTGVPSPNCTTPSLCVALSRSTLSPPRMGRAFTMSLIGCLLFTESSFAPYRTNLKVLGSNTIGFRSWDGAGEVLILAWLGYWDESVGCRRTLWATSGGSYGRARGSREYRLCATGQCRGVSRSMGIDRRLRAAAVRSKEMSPAQTGQ